MTRCGIDRLTRRAKLRGVRDGDDDSLSSGHWRDYRGPYDKLRSMRTRLRSYAALFFLATMDWKDARHVQATLDEGVPVWKGSN